MEENKLICSTYFGSSIYYKEDPSWLKDLNKFSEKHITDAKKMNENFIIERKKEFNKDIKDFALVHHSNILTKDKNFFSFIDYLILLSSQILDHQGYDLKNYALKMSEMWVQEFPKTGGGNHNSHIHWNGHISGFYFLKCSNRTSYPIFHDPRYGKMMIQLPEKNIKDVTEASEKINYRPSPGTLILFNSFMPHEFTVDNGLDTFRFIHFNIQAFPKNYLK